MKTLIYGGGKKYGADLKIDKIKKALRDFANQVEMERIGGANNMKKESSEIGKLKNSVGLCPFAIGG